MSALSDLFHGNFGNIGNDLFGSPTAIAETLGAVALPFAAFAAPALLGGEALAGEAAAEGGLFAAGEAAAGAGGALGFAGDVGAETAGPLSFFDTIAAGGAGGGAGGAAAPVAATGDLAFSGPPSLATAADAGGAEITNVADFATGGGGGGGGIFDTLSKAISPASSFLKTAAPIAGLGGLGYNLYSGYQQNKTVKGLLNEQQQLAETEKANAQQAQTAAAPALTEGEQLMTYLQTGTLPKAFQAQLDNEIKAAKAGVIQGYASRGMNVDPKHNSALQQDLASVDQRALELKSKIESTLADAGNKMVQTANSLLQTGVNATNIAAEIPRMMMQLELTLNKSTADALSSFSAALNGGKKQDITFGQGAALS